MLPISNRIFKPIFNRIASLLWSAVNAVVACLVRARLLKPVDLGVRVISVGNLQAGGSGKTPLVALIAREAIARGSRVCILSRGYGGSATGAGYLIEPGSRAADPSRCGDEPALLHDLVPEAWISVGSDRVSAFARAAQASGATFDLAILDDGFQHWRIRKDVEVLALTSATRADRVFRDWDRAAERAHLRVWTKGEGKPGAAGQELVRVRFRPRRVFGPDQAQGVKPGFEGGRPVWYVTGIGDGSSAVESLRLEGYAVARHIPFPDHARYSEHSIRELMLRAWEAEAILAVTGKDWVKLRGLGFDPERIAVFEPEVEIVEGGNLWNRVLWDSSS